MLANGETENVGWLGKSETISVQREPCEHGPSESQNAHCCIVGGLDLFREWEMSEFIWMQDSGSSCSFASACLMH